jgi:probable phosphoglycerate mutase
LASPEIFLFRHGETEWNATERFQGRLDSPLTQKGRGQAAACGTRFAQLGIRPDLFVASPLGRTRETAQVIAGCADLPDTIYDARLAEVSLGSWDGLTLVDIDQQWPGVLDGSSPFNWFFRSPDGESYAAARERVKAWLDEVTGVTVAVSHGLIGRIIRGAYADLTMAETIALPVPQDVIWHLRDRQIKAIPVE